MTQRHCDRSRSSNKAAYCWGRSKRNLRMREKVIGADLAYLTVYRTEAFCIRGWIGGSVFRAEEAERQE